MTRRAPGEASVIGTAIAAQAAAVLTFLLMGTMAVSIREDLNFDEAAFGAVPAVIFAVAAVGSPIAGRLSERRGPAWGVQVAGLAAAVSMIGIAAFARSWASLLPFVVLAGLSLASAQPSTDLWVTRRLPRHRHGVALGAKQAAAGPGVGLVAGLAVPASIQTLGWRGAFLCASAVGLLVPWLARRGGDGAPTPAPAPTRRRREGDVSLRPLVVLALAGGLGSISQGAFLAFAVSAAVASGMSEGGAGVLFAVSSGVAVVMRLVLGAAADRRPGGLVATTAALLALSAVGYFLFMAETVAAAFMATPLIAATAWSWHGLFFLAVVRTSPHAPGTASGIAASGVLSGGVIGPVAFGIVARDDYPTAWALAAATTLAAAALMLLCRWLIKRDLAARLSPAAP